MAVLAMPALVGGSHPVLQSPQFADPAHCSPHTMRPGGTPGCASVSLPIKVRAPGQTHQNPKIHASDPGQRRSSIPISAGSAPVPKKLTTPTPIPTSPPSPVVPTSQSSVAGMIEQVFGPDAQSAIRIANCESGLNPTAYNPTSVAGSHAEGVFQILYPSTWMNTSQASHSPYNAMANILAAHEIFVRDGYNWHEWTCA